MGEVAIITGGASGIGRALAHALGRRGCEVVLADRQAELAERTAAEIVKAGGKARGRELDVRDRRAFERLASEVGHVDYLFNNAGIVVGGEMLDYEAADWDDVIAVNLNGVVHGIEAVYPRMVARGSGHIINTSSMAGLVTATLEGSYGAAKHAVVGLTKALRVEAASHGVRVSALCPGAIRTPILTGGVFGRMRIRGAVPASLMKLWERMRPMDPDEFAQKALVRIERNEALIVLPTWWKAFWYLERISPDTSFWLAGKLHAHVRQELGQELTGAKVTPFSSAHGMVSGE